MIRWLMEEDFQVWDGNAAVFSGQMMFRGDVISGVASLSS